MKASIKETVLVKGKAKGQDELIRELNPKIRGWCNYHKSAMSSRTFCYLDSYLFQTLYRWGLRKHRKKGKRWVKDRYWHQRGSRKWTFCSDKEELFGLMDVKIKCHVKVISTKNPYIDTEYFHNKQNNRKYERGYRDKSFAM